MAELDPTDDPTDAARIGYLAGAAGVDLAADDQAELDDLRALLADPTLWAEPPAGLEDSVVALIAAEAGTAAAADPARSTGSALTDPVAADTEPTDTEPIALEPLAIAPTDTEPIAIAPIDPEPIAIAPIDPDPIDNAPIDLGAARDRRRRRLPRPAILAAAAAVVVAVVLSAVLILQGGSARTFEVALAPTDLVPAASGSATMTKTDSGWNIHLEATGLPRLDGGQFYQAWLRNADGVLVPIGTFNEGTDVRLWAGVSPADFPVMTITQEGADGDQASSGQRVLVGSAIEN